MNPDQATEAEPDRVAVMVLGMHRSGTSAISRLISLLGCDLPVSLLGPGPGNESGHWESHAIWHFNDELLASGHSSWFDWLEFDPAWYSSALCESFVERGRGLLREEFGSSPLFVLKDPRNSRLFQFWREVLEREHIRPQIIIALRHPGEVAQSLAARDHFDPAYAGQLWLRHMVDAEFQTRGLPRVMASYERLLEDWQVLATQMKRDFDFSWPAWSPQTETDIAGFISNEERHHWLSGEETMPEWFGAVYRILDRWAQIGEDETDHAELDEIRRELNRAAPNFSPLATSAINQARRIHALEAEATAKENENCMLSRTQDAFAQEVHAIEQEQSAMRLEFERVQQEAEDRIATVRAELQREREANRALRSADAAKLLQIDELTAELEQERSAMRVELDRSRRDALDQITTGTAALLAEQAVSHALRSTDEARRQQIDELNTKLAETDQAMGRLLAEHQNTVRQAHALDFSLDNARLHTIQLEKFIKTAVIGLDDQRIKIAKLSVELQKQIEMAAGADSCVKWLRTVLMLVTNRPNWWAAMPEKWRQRHNLRLLHRKGLFDADNYLLRYSDVAEQHIDPLRHYILHGMAEGRAR